MLIGGRVTGTTPSRDYLRRSSYLSNKKNKIAKNILNIEDAVQYNSDDISGMVIDATSKFEANEYKLTGTDSVYENYNDEFRIGSD